MRCRLLPTADVPSHTSGAAMCHNLTSPLSFSLHQWLRDLAGLLDEKLHDGAERAVLQGDDPYLPLARKASIASDQAGFSGGGRTHGSLISSASANPRRRTHGLFTPATTI
jgi:hypothetical protein